MPSSHLIPVLVQILFIALLPLSVSLFLIASVFKKILFASSKIYNKQFIKPASGHSMFFLPDDFTKNPWSVVTVVYSFQGVPERQKVYKDLENILNLKHKNKQIYWKLQAYVELWMGYFWWKKDKSFSLRDHVNFVQGDIQGPKEVSKLLNGYVRKAFKRNKPMWDVTVVSSDDKERIDKKSVVIFRFSHAVMDGMSFLKLYYRIAGHSVLPTDFPRVVSHKSLLNVEAIRCMKGLVFGVYDYLTVVQDGVDFNPLHKFSNKRKHTGDWRSGFVSPISLTKIKEAKKVLKCSFFDLIVAGMSGGLKRFMEIKGTPPSYFHTWIPVPKPNHPDECALNHFLLTNMRIQLDTSNLQERIQAINKVSMGGVGTPRATILDLLNVVMNVLPVGKFAEMWSVPSHTTVGSIMPTGNKLQSLFGLQPTSLQYLVPLARNLSGLSWSCLSGNDSLWISFVADRGCIDNNPDMDLLANCIHTEFLDILKTTNDLLKVKH